MRRFHTASVDSGLTSFNWYNGADMFVDGCPADVIPLGDIGRNTHKTRRYSMRSILRPYADIASSIRRLGAREVLINSRN